MYIKNVIKFKHITIDVNANIESLWVILKLNKYNIAIGVIYRPPTVSILELNNMTDLLAEVTVQSDFLILLGDLNINLLEPHTSGYKVFSTIMECFNLKQIIQEPTRITASSATLLDVICVSENLPITASYTADTPIFSDHRLVSCSLKMETKPNPNVVPFYTRNFCSIDMPNFFNQLISIDWGSVYHVTTVNEKVENFNKILLQLFDTCCPLVLVTPNKRRPALFLTPVVRHIINLKRSAYKRQRRTKKPEHRDYYVALKNHLKVAIDSEKRAYSSFIMNKYKKDAWKILNKLGINFNENKSIITTDEFTPDDINNHILNSSNFGDPTPDIIDMYCDNNSGIVGNFNFNETDPPSVLRQLNKIKSNAIGFDEISIKMLQLTLPYTLDVITHLINFSIKSSTFPDVWKKAVVTPIPKKATLDSVNDIRPISILPTLSKVLERTIVEQLNNHLEDKSILPPVQSGFRRGFSTQTALHKICDDIFREADLGNCTLVGCLDFSKAFDSVSHELLLLKLRSCDLSWHAVNWFASYLHRRMQCVNVSGQRSDFKPVTRGVPQGSICGPTLFSIYCKDLMNVPSGSKLHMYADDTQVYVGCNSKNAEHIVRHFNKDLQNIRTWSINNCLQLNASKTTVVCCGTRSAVCKLKKVLPEIKIDSTPIKVSDSLKNLGLFLDECLSFDKHICHLNRMCYATLKGIYRIKNMVSSELKLHICESLIMSKIQYCLPVFGPALTKYNLQKLQIIQNTCFRFSYNIPKRCRISNFIANSKYLNVSQRILYLFATYLFSIITNNKPFYLISKFSFRFNTHVRNTRHRNFMNIPKFKLTFFKGSFTYVATQIYNKSFELYQKCTSPSAFKKSLKSKIKKEL